MPKTSPSAQAPFVLSISEFENVRLEEIIPEGHHQRLLRKLAHHEQPKVQKKHFRNTLWITSAAAASILIALIVFIQGEIREENRNSARIEIREIAAEAGLIQDRLEQRIQTKSKGININDPSLKADFERFQLLEKEYQKLDSMLQNQVINERIIKAMIENYGHRLRILEAMNQKIKALQLKNNSNKTPRNEQV